MSLVLYNTVRYRYYFLVYGVVVILTPVIFTVFNFTFILLDLNNTSLTDGKKLLESNKGAVVSSYYKTLAKSWRSEAL